MAADVTTVAEEAIVIATMTAAMVVEEAVVMTMAVLTATAMQTAAMIAMATVVEVEAEVEVTAAAAAGATIGHLADHHQSKLAAEATPVMHHRVRTTVVAVTTTRG
jgi:hypothetical protein